MDYYGYTSFVLLVTTVQLDAVKKLVDNYKDIMDISAKEYGKNGYWFVEIEVMDGERECKELADFMFRIFPFVAIRQMDSTYIVTEDKDEFKKALMSLFTKSTKYEFLYNMLSIDERYKALEEACNCVITPYDDIRVERWIGGCMYSLLYSKGQPSIFTPEPEIDLLFETTGYRETVDMTDGLNLFKFHIAILSKKS